MSRLDEAYPPGSVVICRQDLPEDGMVRLPTRLEIRETVISRKADLTTGRGVATWITHGSTAPGLTLTYMFKQRKKRVGLLFMNRSCQYGRLNARCRAGRGKNRS